MDIQYPKGIIVNSMDLRTISKKIDMNVYNSLEDFWADVKWIVHNTKTHCSGKINNGCIFNVPLLSVQVFFVQTLK